MGMEGTRTSVLFLLPSSPTYILILSSFLLSSDYIRLLPTSSSLDCLCTDFVFRHLHILVFRKFSSRISLSQNHLSHLQKTMLTSRPTYTGLYQKSRNMPRPASLSPTSAHAHAHPHSNNGIYGGNANGIYGGGVGGGNGGMQGQGNGNSATHPAAYSGVAPMAMGGVVNTSNSAPPPALAPLALSTPSSLSNSHPSTLLNSNTNVTSAHQQGGTCPGDGRCDGTGGTSACSGCPTWNNTRASVNSLKASSALAHNSSSVTHITNGANGGGGQGVGGTDEPASMRQILNPTPPPPTGSGAGSGAGSPGGNVPSTSSLPVFRPIACSFFLSLSFAIFKNINSIC
ncbi:hypothetical protein C8R43DRAFT_529678 [Mycena crocata]|nr:hypothetical protein C8R43DRAFT_529678 [Mycena crocata]